MASLPADRDADALAAMTRRLATHPGLIGKAEIRLAAAAFPHSPFPGLGAAAALGDDAALLPQAEGPLLLASEGIAPTLVQNDPWFAGWCGVLVNLSDIAAMGGRPLAVVDSLWSDDESHAALVMAGLREAADRFAVPLVGGHTNLHSPYNALAVAVLGMTPGPVLSARAARPGDDCVLLVNRHGRFRHPYPFWDAATQAPADQLRRQLALLPQLAAAGCVHAAKDISMGGLAGTAVMFAEAAGCGLDLHLETIVPPKGVDLEAWLGCFPSFGFLLAAPRERQDAIRALMAPEPDLEVATIGRFVAQPGVRLLHGADRATLWPGGEVLTGFGGPA
jgi:AIR synthase-related protein